MADPGPAEKVRWHRSGPAIFCYVIAAAGLVAYLTGSPETASFPASGLYSRDIDTACLDDVDDDTALLFDGDIDEGRLKACDRSIDRIALPEELTRELADPLVSDDDSFHGYECVGDCSGHRAGYAWAARKGISDPGTCGGRSRSFTEGCIAYARDH